MKKKSIKYTKYGVPILNDNEIEQIAYSLLFEYDSDFLFRPMKTPIAGILNQLQNSSNLEVSFTDLGSDNGNKILGKTFFSKNLICIDENIVYEDEPLFLFTAAHEIGHWVLHRKKPLKKEKSNEEVKETSDNKKDFSIKKKLETTKDWIEHHANVFAGALLMPPRSIYEAVIIIQKKMDINRNLGKIYLDRQQSSHRDFLEIVEGLQKIFGVSKKSIKIRLIRLNILVEDKQTKLRHISGL